MRGDLGQTPAADLCRGLADAGSTGSVTIAHPTGEAGIFFRGGHVYWAESPAPRARLGDRLVNAAILTQEQLVGALRTQAESREHVKLGALLVEQELVTRDVIRVFVQEQLLDALFEITGWREGSYEFVPAAAAGSDERLPVELSVDQMLVEVSRRQSEWDQIQARIPSLDMVPDFVSGGSSASAALEPDEFAVLASVDGRRTIRDLAADLGYSEFEAARIVYGLALLGIVDVRDDEDIDEEASVEEATVGATTAAEAEAAEDGAVTEDSERVDGIDDDLEAWDELSEDTDLDDALEALDGLATDERGDAASDLDDIADLELDLDDLAVADEDDDVDVAAALEEALYGLDDEPVAAASPTPSGPPKVKIHDGPDGFQWDALEDPSHDEPVPTPPQPVAAADDEPDEIATALSAALGEAEHEGDDAFEGATPDPAPTAEDEAATAPEPEDEPEPFVVGGDPTDASTDGSGEVSLDTPVGGPTPAGADFGFFAQPGDGADDAAPDLEDLPPPAAPSDLPAASSDESERVSGAELDDSDFDRLLDELAGTGSDGSSTVSAPYTSSPDPVPSRSQDVAPAPPAASDEMPSPPRSGGDVSEFLRELSRLAIDEPQGGSAPASADDADDEESGGSAAQQAASAAADARRNPPPPASDDGKNKKRGLFGRKR